MCRTNATRARAGSHPATYQEVMKWATSAVAKEGLSSLTMLQGEVYSCEDGRIPKLPQNQLQAEPPATPTNNRGAERGGGKNDSKGNKKTYAGNNKAFLTRGSICMQFNGCASGCTQVNCQRKHVCMAEDEQGVICGGDHSILEHGE